MNNNRMYTPLKFPNYLLYIWSPLFKATSPWGDICILITNVMVKKTKAQFYYFAWVNIILGGRI